jgi:hypothetical protein
VGVVVQRGTHPGELVGDIGDSELDDFTPAEVEADYRQRSQPEAA